MVKNPSQQQRGIALLLSGGGEFRPLSRLHANIGLTVVRKQSSPAVWNVRRKEISHSDPCANAHYYRGQKVLWKVGGQNLRV